VPSHAIPVKKESAQWRVNRVVGPTVAGAAPELVTNLSSDQTAPDFPFHPSRKNRDQDTQSGTNFMPRQEIRQAEFKFLLVAVGRM